MGRDFNEIKAFERFVPPKKKEVRLVQIRSSQVRSGQIFLFHVLKASHLIFLIPMSHFRK